MNDLHANQFEAHRPLLFSIAYRMLGSATEAEDIVQEAYVRYQAASPGQITSPKAYLSTIVTRLCLNRLQSAAMQRETYIGPWLPEPVLTESGSMPEQQAEFLDSISIAFLTLLEALTPPERAVFLLREVFSYPYDEIAEILGSEEAACRQMLSRARKHIAEHRPRFRPSKEAHRAMLDQFIQAVRTGELDGLMRLLAEDVTLWADGGGKARGAAIHPLSGREAVARFVLKSVRLAGADFRVALSEVNGELALVVRSEARVIVVLAITEEDGHIAAIRAMGNPDKLKWVSGTPNGGKERIQ